MDNEYVNVVFKTAVVFTRMLCFQQYRSGWWFNDCYWANLNGPYIDDHNTDQPTCPDGLCVAWLTISGYEEFCLRATKMEILPNPRFYIGGVLFHHQGRY